MAKDQQWVDGRDARLLYRTTYKDEALNQLFEVNSKDVNLRIKLVECELNEKGNPVIDDDWLPALPVIVECEAIVECETELESSESP